MNSMRRSTRFLLYLLLNIVLLVLLLVHASFRNGSDLGALEEMREMAERLAITDLCLFTEANYTRHLSQTDLFTPFQDGPSSLEHFPTGALVRPPEILKRMNEKLDRATEKLH